VLVDSETSVVTSLITRFAVPTQLFKDAHRDRVCVRCNWVSQKKGYLKNEFESKIQFIVLVKFYLIQNCLYVPFPKSFLFGYNFKCFILNFRTE
jgi:hypothetical protein